MTIDSVKKKIKKKFGTYSNFCRVSGMDRYELQRDFLKKKHVDDTLFRRVKELASTLTATVPPHRDKLLLKKIKLLKKALMDAGGVHAFCEQNPEFNTNTVFKILAIDSRYIGRRATVMNQLFKKFGI